LDELIDEFNVVDDCSFFWWEEELYFEGDGDGGVVFVSSAVQLYEDFLDEVEGEEFPEFGTDTHFTFRNFGGEAVGEDETFEGYKVLIGRETGVGAEEYLVAAYHCLGTDFNGDYNLGYFGGLHLCRIMR
jgi:hypothetical protein